MDPPVPWVQSGQEPDACLSPATQAQPESGCDLACRGTGVPISSALLGPSVTKVSVTGSLHAPVKDQIFLASGEYCVFCIESFLFHRIC